MKGGSGARPGRALIFLLLIILTVLVAYDLNSAHSTLASAWHSVTRKPTKGEILRDEILSPMKPRR